MPQFVSRKTFQIILSIGFSYCCLYANAYESILEPTIGAASTSLDEAQNFDFDVTHLSGVLKKVDSLSLYLRTLSDANNNNLVDYLLKQQNICSVRIIIINEVLDRQGIQKYVVNEDRHRAVVVRSINLPFALNMLSSKSGYLLCIIVDQPDLESLREMAQRLWLKSRIYKIYYVTRQDFYFYNPFVRRTPQEFGDFVDVRTMEMDQIFENLNGYPIRMYIFDSVYSSMDGDPNTKEVTGISGADSEAALLLSEKLNFTMQLQWPDDEFFGARLANGSFNGAIGRIIRSETDVTMTGFFVKDYLTRDIEFSVSVYMDELCCYVSKAKRVPQSILPLFAVRLDIWISFFLVGFIGPFIWMSMRYLNLSHKAELIKEAKVHRSLGRKFQYVRIYIDFWVMWVRVNVVNFPPFYSERIFVVSFCLVSVIYGAIMESSLATVYIRPLYYKDINTLGELDESDFRIYIKHAAMKDDLFYGHGSDVYENLDRKVILVAETEDRLIDMMSKRGGFAAVTRASSLLLDDIRYFITQKIHKIPECPKNYHIAFVFQKYSPFEEAFNVNLLRFIEASLIDHWIDMMKHKSKVSINKYPEYMTEVGHQWKVLTLKNLQLPFYSLALGCALATLSFIFEFIIKSRLLCKLKKLLNRHHLQVGM